METLKKILPWWEDDKWNQNQNLKRWLNKNQNNDNIIADIKELLIFFDNDNYIRPSIMSHIFNYSGNFYLSHLKEVLALINYQEDKISIIQKIITDTNIAVDLIKDVLPLLDNENISLTVIDFYLDRILSFDVAQNDKREKNFLFQLRNSNLLADSFHNVIDKYISRRKKIMLLMNL